VYLDLESVLPVKIEEIKKAVSGMAEMVHEIDTEH
jgi:hypothetical protein